MTEEQKKFYDIKHTSDYRTVGEDVDYLVTVDQEKKEIILQFEESDSRTDWKNNFCFLPWPLKLDDKIVWTTRGYAKAYKSAGNIPIDEFEKATTDYSGYFFVIRGWSFGSAMAKIAARHFIIRTGKRCKFLDELTTYGDVKCWLNPFYSIKNHVVRLREYVCTNDLVTWCIPFFRRDKTCLVGGRLSIKKLFKTEYNHTHYEEYDYSGWE